MPTNPDNWWDRVSKALTGQTELPEEATKQRIIEPTLAYLGWDMFSSDVVREYTVDKAGRNESVDYALLISDAPRVLVEAKKLKNALGEREGRQVLGYARLERMQWCVLTNGVKWQLFNADWGDRPQDAPVREWDLTPGPDFPDAIRLLSKESVASGELDRQTGQSRLDQRMIAALSKILPDLERDSMLKARNLMIRHLRTEFPELGRATVDKFVSERLQLSLRSAGPPPPPPPPQPTDVPLIAMEDLPDSEVVVFPSRPAGVEWMKRFNAWGYVRVSRLPPWVGLYVSHEVGCVRYVAQTDRIVAPEDPTSPVRDYHRNDPSYEPGKKVVVFKASSLRRLERDIPIGNNKSAFRRHRFFRLQSFRTARTVDDLD